MYFYISSRLVFDVYTSYCLEIKKKTICLVYQFADKIVPHKLYMKQYSRFSCSSFYTEGS